MGSTAAAQRRRRRNRRVAFEIDNSIDGDIEEWQELLSTSWIEVTVAAAVTAFMLSHFNNGVVAEKLVVVSIVVAIHSFVLALWSAAQRFPKYVTYTSVFSTCKHDKSANEDRLLDSFLIPSRTLGASERKMI